MSLRWLLWKDIRQEMRSREALQAGLVLVALFMLVDLFALDNLRDQPRVAAVVLWTPILSAGAAVVGRGLAREADRGTLDLLGSLPVSLTLHGVSRTLVDGALLLMVGAVSVLAVGAVFAVPLSAHLAGVVALGVAGIAVVGSLAGGLAAQSRAREVLLPLLVVPVLAPLVLSGVQGTVAVLAGEPLGPVPWMLAGYDLIAAGVAWWLWPHVLEGE